MDASRDRVPVDSRRGQAFAALAAVAVSVAGSLMFLLVPVLVEALRTQAPWLGEQQVGIVGSGDAAGMFLGAILALALVGSCDRRWLAAGGLALLCLANLGSLFAETYPALLAARLLAGVGGGLAVGIGHAAFAVTRQPDRSIAIYLVVQTCVGSAFIAALSRLIPAHGVDALFFGVFCLGLAGCALAPWIDAHPAASHADARARANVSARDAGKRAAVGALCLAGNLLLATAFMAAWANVDSIGKAYRLNADGVAAAISLALLAATAGSLLVAVVGQRFGRSWPFVAFTGLTLAGIVLLGRPLGMVAYGVALLMMMFGTSGTSYIFGALSAVDPGGRLPIAHPLSLKAGFALGPALGSLLIVHGGFALALLFAGAGTLVVILLGLLAFKRLS